MAGGAMQVPAVCRSDFSATILGQPDVNLPLTGLLLSRQLERAYREKVPHTVAPRENIWAIVKRLLDRRQGADSGQKDARHGL